MSICLVIFDVELIVAFSAGNRLALERGLTAGRFGVHLVREISPWSSQVLCIGLVKT